MHNKIVNTSIALEMVPKIHRKKRVSSFLFTHCVGDQRTCNQSSQGPLNFNICALSALIEVFTSSICYNKTTKTKFHGWLLQNKRSTATFKGRGSLTASLGVVNYSVRQ